VYVGLEMVLVGGTESVACQPAAWLSGFHILYLVQPVWLPLYRIVFDVGQVSALGKAFL
jgi:hypothetical protein